MAIPVSLLVFFPRKIDIAHMNGPVTEPLDVHVRSLSVSHETEVSYITVGVLDKRPSYADVVSLLVKASQGNK